MSSYLYSFISSKPNKDKDILATNENECDLSNVKPNSNSDGNSKGILMEQNCNTNNDNNAKLSVTSTNVRC